MFYQFAIYKHLFNKTVKSDEFIICAETFEEAEYEAKHIIEEDEHAVFVGEYADYEDVSNMELDIL